MGRVTDVDGGDRLQRDQVDLAAPGDPVEVGEAVGVAGVAAAGDEQPVGLRPPAVGGADADRLGEVLERVDPGVRAPVGDALGVVVAVVGGGPFVDLAVRADANLDPLPIVFVETLVSDDRDAAQGGGIGVVGPILCITIETIWESLPDTSASAASGIAPRR